MPASSKRNFEEEDKKWGKKLLFPRRRIPIPKALLMSPMENSSEDEIDVAGSAKRPYQVTPYKYGTSDGHVGEGVAERGPSPGRLSKSHLSHVLM